MKPDRWTEVCRLFDAAREMPRENRDAFLEGECRGDRELEAEVGSLLASDEGESFLDRPLPGLAAPLGHAGPYELLGEIGRGGMGVVYRAVRRDQGFERFVAVKLVKRGMDTDFILRRFESERRILAELDHPNIARVLDGGSTEDGLPYFVMELIEGKHLLEYCEEKKLDTRARLALFRQVCFAVTYAHQRLVIHRDIKPANILVTEEGVPKLLDFGISKLLAGESGAAAERTATEFRVLTPEYASPEQVLGREITTSSDVYSLGVVLYELLTGQRPYKLDTGSPEEITGAVLHQQPERPSTKARLHRDLDHIVLMALRKEPERRYASAEQLGEDIRRFREGLPVRATPDSFGYRAGKFVRRHRAGVAASVLVAASLVGGLGLALWQMRVAQRERGRAQEHLAQVRKLATSFLFEHHDAIKDLAGSTPARKLLVDRGVAYLDLLSRETGGDPAFQRDLAEAYQRLGRLQGGMGNEGTLGASEAALQSYRKSFALLESLAGNEESDPKDRNALARSHITLGHLVLKMGGKSEALAHFRQAAAIREALVAANPADADIRNDLGVAYHSVATGLSGAGDLSGALDARRKEARLFAEVVSLKPGDSKARRNLALAYQYLGSELAGDASHPDPRDDFPASAEALEKARAIQEGLCAEDPGNATYKKDLSSTDIELGFLLEQMGQPGKAVESYRKSLRIREALEAADPNDIMVRVLLTSAQIRLGSALSRVGAHSEAVEHGRKALALAESVAAADPRNVFHQSDVAHACYELGKSLHGSSAASRGIERIPLLREAVASLRRGHEIYSSLQKEGLLPAAHSMYSEDLSAHLKICEEELAKQEG
jgi:tetratricopeptide (TPR) repeat protein/tRNA A-37 threonylcarbamoyl transferase component Bud32